MSAKEKSNNGITLKELEFLKDKKNEIKILEERIGSYKKNIVFDTVSSATTFPYKKHTIKIQGISNNNYKKILKLEKILMCRKMELLREVEKAERYIDTIKDSKARQIIQLRYIDGLDWIEVAKKVYGYPEESTPRKYINRYFK